MSRKHIPHKVELAAALLQIPALRAAAAIDLVRATTGMMAHDAAALVRALREGGVPHDHAKLMTPDQIISLFHRDHYPIRKEHEGPDEPWNLTWRFRRDHINKTAKVDAPEAAKSRHVRKAQVAHSSRMLAKYGVELKSSGFDPSAPRPKRPMRSRGFDRSKTRGFDGKVRKRK